MQIQVTNIGELLPRLSPAAAAEEEVHRLVICHPTSGRAPHLEVTNIDQYYHSYSIHCCQDCRRQQKSCIDFRYAIPTAVELFILKYQGKPQNPFETHPLLITISILAMLLSFLASSMEFPRLSVKTNRILRYTRDLSGVFVFVWACTGDMFTEEQNELVEWAAEMLYGLIHVRYILTSKGMSAMLDRVKCSAKCSEKGELHVLAGEGSSEYCRLGTMKTTRSGKSNDGSLEVIVRPVFQHNANYSEEEIGFDLHISEYEAMKEFYVCVSDEPVIQTNIPNRLENQLLTGEYDSPSSEWEHILTEDTW
ncbi:hypothetical protein HHK36_000818 [Tetracentron sinense]|uniref:Casein kinase II subunit beta n=1 Tax=Tetracentron sinense TaxID=13715 RepID=A0A835DR21_TETSI|nr:hypothetical protein HHK36_000818 [Tetracentron sinense]